MASFNQTGLRWLKRSANPFQSEETFYLKIMKRLGMLPSRFRPFPREYRRVIKVSHLSYVYHLIGPTWLYCSGRPWRPPSRCRRFPRRPPAALYPARGTCCSKVMHITTTRNRRGVKEKSSFYTYFRWWIDTLLYNVYLSSLRNIRIVATTACTVRYGCYKTILCT